MHQFYLSPTTLLVYKMLGNIFISQKQQDLRSKSTLANGTGLTSEFQMTRDRKRNCKKTKQKKPLHETKLDFFFFALRGNMMAYFNSCPFFVSN